MKNRISRLISERHDAAGSFSFSMLLVAQLIATTGFTFVMPFMPLYVQQLGVEDAGPAAAWAGFINGSAGVTMALAAPLWGKLADRVGRKPMLLRATLAASVVVGLMGFVTSPWQLLGLRLVQGALTGTVPAATALVASTAPKEKAGFRLGALQMVIFVAAGLGPALGGTFAELSGIRHSFFLTSALLAASGVMVLLGVKEVKPVREESGEESEERGKAGLPYRLLVPGLLTLFVVHIAITSVGVALPGFLATLEDVGRGIAGQAGWILGTGALAAAAGSVLGGRVAGKIGARRAIVIALALAGLTAIPQAFVSTVPELWVLRLVTSFFLGAVVPVANLAIRDTVPQERRGAAFGVASSAVAVGFAVGPIGGGLISSALGFWSAFLIPGVLLAALAGVLALVWGAPRLRTGRRFGTILRATVGHLIK